MMALTVSGVRKSYSGTQVLRGVSLSVRPGTLTAILGASGAGKTTLLRVIAGFEPADGGSVTLGGTRWRPSAVTSATSPRTGRCSRT